MNPAIQPKRHWRRPSSSFITDWGFRSPVGIQPGKAHSSRKKRHLLGHQRAGRSGSCGATMRSLVSTRRGSRTTGQPRGSARYGRCKLCLDHCVLIPRFLHPLGAGGNSLQPTPRGKWDRVGSEITRTVDRPQNNLVGPVTSQTWPIRSPM